MAFDEKRYAAMAYREGKPLSQAERSLAHVLRATMLPHDFPSDDANGFALDAIRDIRAGLTGSMFAYNSGELNDRGKDLLARLDKEERQR